MYSIKYIKQIFFSKKGKTHGSKKIGNLIQRDIGGEKWREISRWQCYSNHTGTNMKIPGKISSKIPNW